MYLGEPHRILEDDALRFMSTQDRRHDVRSAQGSVQVGERALHRDRNNQVYSYSDILLFLEKIVRQQECDAIFVDPYNSLKIELTGNGNPDYHYQAASEFLTFSTSNDVAVWLNMHAVTEAQRRKGHDGLPVAPYAEDTEGGKFVNRADCFMTIPRKVQAPDHNIKRQRSFTSGRCGRQ